MTYRIKTIEKLTGISRNTITAWERRYNLVTPIRDDSGYRAYTEQDVGKLRRVKALLDQGYQIGEVIGMIEPAEAPPAPTTTLSRLRDAVDRSLLDMDHSSASTLAQEMSAFAIRDRLDQVWMPILYETGVRWEAGVIGVAQEHFVSAFVREELLGMLRSLDHGPTGGPSAVCAGFPREEHELGLLGVAVRLALLGNRVTYLGANLPAADLLELLREHPTQLICSSLLIPRPGDEVLTWAQELAMGTETTMVAVGGPGVAGLRSDHPRVHLFVGFEQLAQLIRR